MYLLDTNIFIELLQKFIKDTFYNSEINLVRLRPLEVEQLVTI